MNITIKKIGLIIIVVLVLLSFGCIPHKQYRKDYILCQSSNPVEQCGKKALQQYLEPENLNKGYFLGFVEFDDQGQLWDRKQLASITDELKKDIETEDTLMLVFVHGWKHSAEVGDSNIQSFRRTLKRLSELESLTSKYLNIKPRKIAGIYVGWRGGSSKIPLIKEATFWDRKNTAHKVGYGGMTEVFSRLERIKKTKQAMAQKEGKNSNSKLIIIGHSFGGAVVYSAVSEILENNFIQVSDINDPNSSNSGFSDLVVLINPAFEAARFSSLNDMSSEQKTYSVHQLPLLAVLTSEADDATKIAFPAGRYISTVLEKERKVKRFNPITQEEEIIDQGKANVTSIGHFSQYRTHYLKATSTIDQKDENRDAFDLNAEIETFLTASGHWENDSPGNKIQFAGSELERSFTSAGRNPYLNIYVDKELISDHNDIEDPRIESFIRHLILIASQNDLLGERIKSRNKMKQNK